MVAVQSISNLGALTVEQAEHWVAAALAEARALRQYDDQMYPRDADPAALAVADGLHAAWAQWADQADALYDRIRPLLKERRHIDGADDLDHAIGRIRARLQVTPESHLQGLEEIRRGDVVSMEEVRRELRDRVERHRSAGVSAP